MAYDMHILTCPSLDVTTAWLMRLIKCTGGIAVIAVLPVKEQNTEANSVLCLIECWVPCGDLIFDDGW
jgi:hypothetical protein